MVEQPAQPRPLNVILLGPPGAGKSTIAEALAGDHRLAVIATGQRLRDEVASNSPLGRAVAAYLERGDLAPDSLMDRLLRANFDTLDLGRGILLDGYPRTIAQAVGLVGMLADYGRALDVVLALEVEDDEIVRRLSGRRICEGAGDPFPVHIDDLASILRCRERQGRLVQRDDDRPEIVRQRLKVYHDQTQPLLEFYAATSLLRWLDARKSPAEVARAALDALKQTLERRASP